MFGSTVVSGGEGEGDGDVMSLQREEIPRQILELIVGLNVATINLYRGPSRRLSRHLRAAAQVKASFFILINTSTNTPILQHFTTSSLLHGVICSYSNPVVLVHSRRIVILSSTRPRLTKYQAQSTVTVG
jgi:hypothetical protein